MNKNTSIAEAAEQILEAIRKKRGLSVSPRWLRDTLYCLAQLAAQHQFYNPVNLCISKQIRDAVLYEFRKLRNL